MKILFALSAANLNGGILERLIFIRRYIIFITKQPKTQPKKVAIRATGIA